MKRLANLLAEAACFGIAGAVWAMMFWVDTAYLGRPPVDWANAVVLLFFAALLSALSCAIDFIARRSGDREGRSTNAERVT